MASLRTRPERRRGGRRGRSASPRPGPGACSCSGLGLYVLARIFNRIELVAFSFVLALFLTAILHPLERAFSRLVPGPTRSRPGSRCSIGVAALVGIGWFVTWQITDHSPSSATRSTDFVDQAPNWLQTGPLHLKSSDLDKLADNITKAVKAHQGQLVSGAIETVRTVVEALAALLLILLSTFFLLRDGDEIWGWALRLFPRAAQERVDRAGRVGWRTLGGYMRGQVLIALFHGISVMIVLFVLQRPARGRARRADLPRLVRPTRRPHRHRRAVHRRRAAGARRSPRRSWSRSRSSCWCSSRRHLLQPLIMSRSVEVHPLAIALAVITGTVLAGIVGALLAVPLVAFLNATITALHQPTAGPVADPARAGGPHQGLRRSRRGRALSGRATRRTAA